MYLGCILIIPSHPRLGLLSGLFLSGFSTKIFYAPVPSTRATFPSHLILLDWSPERLVRTAAEAFHYAVSSVPLLPRLCWTEISSSALFSRTPRTQTVFFPSLTAGKIMLLWDRTLTYSGLYKRGNLC
jgi:hypothetical protein